MTDWMPEEIEELESVQAEAESQAELCFCNVPNAGMPLVGDLTCIVCGKYV